MRRSIVFFVSIILIIPTIIFAQLKIGYVDSNTILRELSDAQDAQKTIDALVQEWKDELQKMQKELDAQNTDFEKRKLIMSDNKRLEIENEITKMKNDINNYRQSKFGFQGELYAQQEEIMKPVQNKIFNAIETVAEDEELDYVFDRSGDIVFLYAKEDYDITYLVLEILK